MNKKKIIPLVVFLALILVGAFISIQSAFSDKPTAGVAERIGKVYFGTYKAIDVDKYLTSNDSVKVTLENDIYFFDGPGNEEALIFYPGAQIEYTGYAPLMHKLAEKGIDCFLVKMPMSIAFFGMNKADEIINSHNYNKWNLSGHSLGGVVISIYASKTSQKIDGMYLLASYLQKEIDNDYETVYIYGNNDKILSMDEVEKSYIKPSGNLTTYVIQGGNHSQFGTYETPLDDGEASISAEEQIQQTVDFILKNKNIK